MCPNQEQTSKPLSLFPHGPITAPISLPFITKLPKSVVSTWCLKQIEQNQCTRTEVNRKYPNHSTEVKVENIEMSERGMWNPLKGSNVHYQWNPRRREKIRKKNLGGNNQKIFLTLMRDIQPHFKQQKEKINTFKKQQSVYWKITFNRENCWARLFLWWRIPNIVLADVAQLIGAGVSQPLGTRPHSRSWAAGDEQAKLHLYLQPLPIACFTAWALPPVRSAAALDSHRSSNPIVNLASEGSKLRI